MLLAASTACVQDQDPSPGPTHRTGYTAPPVCAVARGVELSAKVSEVCVTSKRRAEHRSDPGRATPLELFGPLPHSPPGAQEPAAQAASKLKLEV